MGKRKAVDSSPAVLHADDADKADTKRTRQALDQDATAAKAAPVLQWMRVPIALQGSVALALQHVRGLDPALAKSLEQGTQCWNRMPTRRTFFLHQQLAYRACIQCKPRCGTSPPVVPALNTTSALAPPPAAVKHFPICSQCCKVSSGTQNPYRTSHIAVKCLHRVGTRGLSALVVVPSKDLAKQVFHVLQQLCPPIGLTAALVNGQLSEAQEAAALEAQCPAGPTTGAHPRSLSAQSTAQLVVATPGRLVAHLQAGLSLSALQFLVVDEVDRLMRQSYNQWLPLVLQALGAPTQQVGRAHSLTGEHDRGTQLGIQGALETSCHRVVKLVASATITTDPAKLARLELHAPRYVALSATDHRHSLPSTLKEFRVMCSDGDKGLVLLCLLGTMVGQQTIVFAASVDATHRCSGGVVCVYVCSCTCAFFGENCVACSCIVCWVLEE